MRKALLVIDMQNVCVGKNHTEFFQYDKHLIDNVNEIINSNLENEIIYIRNIMKKNLINRFAPFKAYEGTQEIELDERLKITSDKVFDKFREDAFSNTELNDYLKKQKIDTIEVIGVDGGGCAALTALGAVRHGYNVIVNTKGIGTMFEKNRIKYYKKLKEKGAQII